MSIHLPKQQCQSIKGKYKALMTTAGSSAQWEHCLSHERNYSTLSPVRTRMVTIIGMVNDLGM